MRESIRMENQRRMERKDDMFEAFEEINDLKPEDFPTIQELYDELKDIDNANNA